MGDAHPKLNIYNLGSKGVNRVLSPIHKEDGELMQAQNAVSGVVQGQHAIKKRWGMVAYNGDAMNGPIQTIYNLPVASFADPVPPPVLDNLVVVTRDLAYGPYYVPLDASTQFVQVTGTYGFPYWAALPEKVDGSGNRILYDYSPSYAPFGISSSLDSYWVDTTIDETVLLKHFTMPNGNQIGFMTLVQENFAVIQEDNYGGFGNTGSLYAVVLDTTTGAIQLGAADLDATVAIDDISENTCIITGPTSASLFGVWEEEQFDGTNLLVGTSWNGATWASVGYLPFNQASNSTPILSDLWYDGGSVASWYVSISDQGLTLSTDYGRVWKSATPTSSASWAAVYTTDNYGDRVIRIYSDEDVILLVDEDVHKYDGTGLPYNIDFMVSTNAGVSWSTVFSVPEGNFRPIYGLRSGSLVYFGYLDTSTVSVGSSLLEVLTYDLTSGTTASVLVDPIALGGDWGFVIRVQ
jgi:hypothetical protein